MIFGNIQKIDEYNFLSQNLRTCFKFFLDNNGLESMEKGSYEINGDDIYVNIVGYTTKNENECFWEAHRKYIDIHVMISGKETININFISNMCQGEFQEEKDYLPLSGDYNSQVVLGCGDFLICYPNDAHETAIKVEDSLEIKKAIFKVKI